MSIFTRCLWLIGSESGDANYSFNQNTFSCTAFITIHLSLNAQFCLCFIWQKFCLAFLHFVQCYIKENEIHMLRSHRETIIWRSQVQIQTIPKNANLATWHLSGMMALLGYSVTLPCDAAWAAVWNDAYRWLYTMGPRSLRPWLKVFLHFFSVEHELHLNTCSGRDKHGQHGQYHKYAYI